jgi:hypothetical protein
MTDTVQPAQISGRYRSFSPSRLASYGLSIPRAVHFCTVWRRASRVSFTHPDQFQFKASLFRTSGLASRLPHSAFVLAVTYNFSEWLALGNLPQSWPANSLSRPASYVCFIWSIVLPTSAPVGLNTH